MKHTQIYLYEILVKKTNLCRIKKKRKILMWRAIKTNLLNEHKKLMWVKILEII